MSDAFQAALNALKTQLSKEAVEPLNGANYEVAHQAFEAASPQRQLLGDWLNKKLGSLEHKNESDISWLSIGCGAGHLDLPLLSQHGGRLARYVGLEPNPSHIELIAPRISDVPQAQLVASTLEDWSSDERFDLVTAIHVIYYADDADVFLKDALAACRPSGETVIAVAPLNAMNRMAEIFWSAQSVTATFSDALEQKLRTLGRLYERQRIEAGILLSAYESDINGQHILDFTVQARTSGLSDAAKLRLQDTLRAAAIGSGTSAYLDHSVDVFTIEG